MGSIWELLHAQHSERPVAHAASLTLLGKTTSGKMSHLEVMVVVSKKLMSREVNRQIFSHYRVKYGKTGVLVSAGTELIFFSVAAVFWFWRDTNTDNTPRALVFAKKSRTFSNFSCLADEQVYKCWDGAQPGCWPKLATEIFHTMDIMLSF